MNHSYNSCTPSSPFAMNIPQIRIRVRARPRKLEWKQTHTHTMPSLKFREIRISQVHNVHTHTHISITHRSFVESPEIFTDAIALNSLQYIVSMGHHECSKNRWQEANSKHTNRPIHHFEHFSFSKSPLFATRPSRPISHTKCDRMFRFDC